MDEARKQLQRSVLLARNLYRRTEFRQRQRIQRLQVRVERRTARALRSVRELLDFNPTLDLNGCLKLPHSAEESPAPKPERGSAPTRADSKKPTISRQGQRVRTSPRSVTGEQPTRPAGEKRSVAGKAELHRKPPSPGSHSSSTREQGASHSADALSTKPGETGKSIKESQRQNTAQKAVAAVDAAATQKGKNSPVSEAKGKGQKAKPSLAERRRQWARSRHHERKTQPPGALPGDKQAEKRASDNSGKPRKPGVAATLDKSAHAEPATATAATASRDLRAVIESDADARLPAARDPQTPATTARAGVQIDPIETEPVVPADDRQASSQQNETRDFASRSDEIGLVRELGEAVYLYGIDRT